MYCIEEYLQSLRTDKEYATQSQEVLLEGMLVTDLDVESFTFPIAALHDWNQPRGAC